jgi:tetratricopeptide (TPR) repeat protein
MFEKSILSELADRFFENNNHFLARKIYKLINTPESIYRVGLSFFKEADYESSVDYFIESFEAGLNNKDVFNMIATSLEKLGDLETAELYYQKAREF